MTTRVPMYEGDGYIHATTDLTLAREAHRLRNEAIIDMFAKVILWFRARAERAQVREAERGLAGAVDHADLEARMRKAERARRPSYI